jgi:hypothetical protein
VVLRPAKRCNQSTLRTPRRFAAPHPSLFPCSTSASSDRPSTRSRRSWLHSSVAAATSKDLGPLPRGSLSGPAFPVRVLCLQRAVDRSLESVADITVQGLDPSRAAAETLVVHRLPPCRWTRPLTGCPAATVFALDFEVLIHSGDPRFPWVAPRITRSPPQVSPSLGAFPTRRPPGYPGLSAHDVPDSVFASNGLARASSAFY